MREIIQQELRTLGRVAEEVAAHHADAVARLAALYVSTLKGGGKLCFAGNGGSAADAQHMATEYVVRYSKNRRPLAALALTTDTSLITACANDLSFEEIFSRQVEALCRPGDLLVIHSTSGASENVIRAAKAARALGVKTAALLGKGGGPLKDQVDLAVVVPSDSTSHIQELHLAIEHIVCGLVEKELGDGPTGTP